MLELYQFEQCSYCAKVRTKLTELELDYICRNIPKGSKKREHFLKFAPKMQVPYLVDVDKGVAMYESDDIIDYLEKEYGGGGGQ